MWTEKYRPTAIERMVGNEQSRLKLLAWFAKWKKGKAALLVGPPGTGKTTLVHLLALSKGLNLVELNASDARTKEKLSKKMGEAMVSTSLLAGGTLIFLDEVDGLAGRSDYGAVEFIKDSIKRSQVPIIMAANDPESDEVRKLGDASTVIRFRPPPPREVELYLRMIAKEEGTPVTEEQLMEVIRLSGGDIRFAVNGLQSGVSNYKDVDRTTVQSINSFFEARDEAVALRALRDYPGQPRDKIRDIFASVLKARLPERKRAAALEAISHADITLGRMLNGKDWRLLRYFDAVLASELRSALEGESVLYSQESVSWPLQLRIWNDSRKIKEIGSLAGKRLGIGQRGMLVEDFPYMMQLCSSKEFRAELIKSLNLDEPFEAFIAREAASSKQ